MSDLPLNSATAVRCSRCRMELLPADRFCSECGANVNNCRRCGAGLMAGNRACPDCGAAVDPGAITANLSGGSPGADATTDAEWQEIFERVQAATIGELHFIQPLGRGGMAAVYLAEEIALGRKVAVKLILPHLMTDERMVRRFREEARTVASLRHASIVRVYAVREAAGIHFFTMDYIEGRPLDAILDVAGRLPIPVVRSILAQVASALGQAHRQGIVHRDIKPSNILIDMDGNAFVSDFGIAKTTSTAGKGKTLTQLGAVVGTPAYISPEQCLGQPVTPASDQYALGIVAYELLTGRPPFEGKTDFAMMRAHTDDAPPPMTEFRCEAPEALERAVRRMLAKGPDDRFASMAEAKDALEAVVLRDDSPLRASFAELAAPAPAPPPIHTPAPPSKSDVADAQRVEINSRPLMPERPIERTAEKKGFASATNLPSLEQTPDPPRAPSVAKSEAPAPRTPRVDEPPARQEPRPDVRLPARRDVTSPTHSAARRRPPGLGRAPGVPSLPDRIEGYARTLNVRNVALGIVGLFVVAIAAAFLLRRSPPPRGSSLSVLDNLAIPIEVSCGPFALPERLPETDLGRKTGDATIPKIILAIGANEEYLLNGERVARAALASRLKDLYEPRPNKELFLVRLTGSMATHEHVGDAIVSDLVYPLTVAQETKLSALICRPDDILDVSKPPSNFVAPLPVRAPDQLYLDVQVERAVELIPGTANLTYPDMLRSANVEGEVLAQFVVNARGRFEVGSLKVLKSSHDLFSVSVRNALPMMRFRPAELGGKKVRQLVQQPFDFTLTK